MWANAWDVSSRGFGGRVCHAQSCGPQARIARRRAAQSTAPRDGAGRTARAVRAAARVTRECDASVTSRPKALPAARRTYGHVLRREREVARVCARKGRRQLDGVRAKRPADAAEREGESHGGGEHMALKHRLARQPRRSHGAEPRDARGAVRVCRLVLCSVETSTKDARVKGGLAAPLHTAARCSTQRARYRACTLANWASQKSVHMLERRLSSTPTSPSAAARVLAMPRSSLFRSSVWYPSVSKGFDTVSRRGHGSTTANTFFLLHRLCFARARQRCRSERSSAPLALGVARAVRRRCVGRALRGD